ncbi:GDSL-type esterase/lipase family protein [Thermodesulfobacteriota bacterium]
MFREKLVLIKKIIWHFLIVISAFGIIALSFGFIKSMKVTYHAKIASDENKVNASRAAAEPSASEHKNANLIKITIMGDSIAKGMGDETGKGPAGYIPYYFRNLTSKDISGEDIGINGLHSAGFLKQLQSEKPAALITDSDYIVISIGGNDAREILSARGISREDEFNDILDTYLTNLKESLKIIRRDNPSCIIVLLEPYNPYQNEDPEDNYLLNNWNFKTEQILENDRKAIGIPTDVLFRFNIGRFIAADGLHPNSAGYRAISEMISKSVESFLVKEK